MSVAAPVPPLATASVPPKVSVPLEVIGPPVKVRPVVPPEPSTLVTVPVPDTDTQAGSPAVSVKTCPFVPLGNSAVAPAPV